MWWIHMISFSGLSSTAANKLLAGKMITLTHNGHQQVKVFEEVISLCLM
jgi:hypothetical protein